MCADEMLHIYLFCHYSLFISNVLNEYVVMAEDYPEDFKISWPEVYVAYWPSKDKMAGQWSHCHTGLSAVAKWIGGGVSLKLHRRRRRTPA